MLSDTTDCRRVWWLPASLALVSLLLATGAQSAVALAKPAATLKDICINAQVAIASVENFERIMNEFKADEKFEICPKRYRLAFTTLEPIILDGQNLVCSEEKFASIKRFHSQFIPKEPKVPNDDDKAGEQSAQEQIELKSASTEASHQLDTTADEIRCPISLQQFFKSYALQVSGLCKQRLVDNVDLAKRSMNDDDYDFFALLEFKSLDRSKSSRAKRDKTDESDQSDVLANIMKDLNKLHYNLSFRELVYMPELGDEVEKGDAKGQQETVPSDLREKPELRKFMRRCKKRFRPVYSQLVLPIVRLAKLGYDYFGRHLERYKDKLQSEDINTWLLVTVLCESYGANLELADEDEDEDEEQQMKTLDFRPTYNRPIEGELWIKGAQQLANELRFHDKMHQRGLQKFLADWQLAAANLANTLDPKQFDWYRKNERNIQVVTGTVKTFTTLMAKTAKILKG